MLKNSKLVGFLATSQPELAKHFYTEKLGLSLLEDTPFAIVVESKGSVVRIQKMEQVQPQSYTALGWEVENINETVSNLLKAGVEFKQFDGLDQNELGIWSSPSGAKVAWLKDPDGNLLSLTQST